MNRSMEDGMQWQIHCFYLLLFSILKMQWAYMYVLSWYKLYAKHSSYVV